MVAMASAPDEEPAFDSPDGFALRVKHQKHIFCIPVEPKTTYDSLAQICLDLLARADLPPPSQLKATSFGDLRPEDVAFFEGAHSSSGGNQDSSAQLRFVEVPRKKASIGAMGFKEGPDAILFLGFKDSSSEVFTQPEVSIPPIFEEEDDEEQQ